MENGEIEAAEEMIIDYQTQMFDPVCFCVDGNRQCAFNHNDIENMIDLLKDQFAIVGNVNANIEEDCDFMEQSFEKIAFVRGGNYSEQIMKIIRQKDKEINELKLEVSKLLITRKENEILKMKVAHLDDDQRYLKDKLDPLLLQ